MVDKSDQPDICTCGQAGHGNTHEPGCPRSDKPCRQDRDGLRTFNTAGTILRRTVNVFTITCESAEIADRVADQLRTKLPTRDGAEGAIAGPIAFDPEMLRRDALIREDIAPPKPAPHALHHNDGDDFLTQARKTIGHLSHAADVVSGKPAHDAMRKALTPSEKVETEIVAQLVLQWAENPEMRLHRARCQSLLDIIGRLSAPVPPADGAGLWMCPFIGGPAWIECREHDSGAVKFYKTPSSLAVAAESVATPAAHWRVEGQPDPHCTTYNCERATLALGHLSDDQIANNVFLDPNIVNLTAAKERIRWLSRRLYASPPVRGDRETIAHTRYANGKYDLREVLRAGFREMRFVHPDIAADDMLDAILSVPVQSGAGEREASRILRGWAKAYRDTPEHRFPSDPNAEFFPVDLENAADLLSRQAPHSSSETK